MEELLHKNTSEATRLADAGFTSKLERLHRIIDGGEKTSYREDPRLAAPLARFTGYEMAVKPPSPTAAIAVGQSDVLPSYLKVQWKPMFKQSNLDEIENPANLAVGAFDLGFMLIYLYPLMVIALSFNLLSVERENGTQVLLLSQPVSIQQSVIGKVLLRGGAIIGVGVVTSLIALLVGSPDILGEGQIWRLGLFSLIVALYGLFWFALAVLVNAFGKRSATNALALLAVWIALVLIVPAAVTLAAKSLFPLPSRIEMVQALRRGGDLAEKQSKFDRSYRADLLRKGEEDALEASTADFYKRILPIEERGEQIARPIFDRFNRQRLAQQDLAETFKYASPAAIAQVALSELANHSARNYNDFTNQVEGYHRTWRNYFLPAVMANRLLTRSEMENVPRFQYRPEPNSIIWSRLAADILGLLIISGMVAFAGAAVLRRYPAAAK